MSRRLPPNSYVFIPKGSLQSLEVTRALMYETADGDYYSFAEVIYSKQKTASVYLIRDVTYSLSYYPPSSYYKQTYFNTLGGL